MEIETTNGHSKKKVARKAASFATKAKSTMVKAERSAERMVKKGQVALEKSEAGTFIKRNPKSAVGIALGAGLLVGAIANGKLVRATALGLAAYIGKRFF